MDQQHLPIPLLSKISGPTHTSAVSALPFIPLQWAEPTVTQAYSRRGNCTVYLMGVTPYSFVNNTAPGMFSDCQFEIFCSFIIKEIYSSDVINHI